MNYNIEGEGAHVNEKGEEQPLKAGDFALVDPDEKHQYRNKGDKPFKMICGVPKEFEWTDSLRTKHLTPQYVRLSNFPLRIEISTWLSSRSRWLATIRYISRELIVLVLIGMKET